MKDRIKRNQERCDKLFNLITVARKAIEVNNAAAAKTDIGEVFMGVRQLKISLNNLEDQAAKLIAVSQMIKEQTEKLAAAATAVQEINSIVEREL